MVYVINGGALPTGGGSGVDQSALDAAVSSAQTSAASALASAAAAASLLGAGLYATKAEADAAVGSHSDGDFVVVAVDEVNGNTISLYQVDTGALVFVRVLADVDSRKFLGQVGVSKPRNLLNALSLWNENVVGATGLGNPPYIGQSITASQSGTTVMASAAVFSKLHSGTVIRWASGEEAVIVDVDNVSASYAAIATATVDRSQAVASGPAKVCAPHIVGVSFGDSVGNRIAPTLMMSLWRSLGFGGYVFHANNADGTQLGNVGSVSYSGGASDNTSDTYFPDYPWGQRWSLPSGGAITLQLGLHAAIGQERIPRHLLNAEDMKTDTAVLVWRLGAGAFTVSRKRHYDPDSAYEIVATVADASAGSGSFGYARYSHDLSHDWIYRITGTSGTVYPVALIMLNNTRAGYVHWQLSRGGEAVVDFNTISSAELAELCQIIGQPRFRIIHAYDAAYGNVDVSDYKPALDANRLLWQTAAPLCDHIWTTGWQAATNTAEQSAWNEAVYQVATSNGDSLVPLEDLFSDFTSSTGLGWLQDGVHSNDRGSLIWGWKLFNALGINDFPAVSEARHSSRLGHFGEIELGGVSLTSHLALIRQRQPSGATWLSGTHGSLVGDNALSAAVGTNDFSVVLDVDVLSSSPNVRLLAAIDSNKGVQFAAGQLVIYQQSTYLRFELRNAANTASYLYSYQYFGTYSGRRTVAIVSDTARGRFDIFVDGQRALRLVGTVVPGTGTEALGTWVGLGTDFAIGQAASNASSAADVHGAMVFQGRLTEAQIQHIHGAFTPPPGTTPDLWWALNHGLGRIVRDMSGNDKDGLWIKSNPNQYNATSPIDWNAPRRGLSHPWVASANSATTLVPGDDMVCKQTIARDWTLPAAPRVGDRVRVTRAASSSGNMQFAQPALHQILTGAGTTVGTDATTIGTTGKLRLSDPYSSVELVCTRAEAGVAYEWVIASSKGALVFV